MKRMIYTFVNYKNNKTKKNKAKLVMEIKMETLKKLKKNY